MNITPITGYTNNNVSFSSFLRRKTKNYDIPTSYEYPPMQADTVEFSNKTVGYTGWVEIPSGNHDSENFFSNFRILNFFWGNDWDYSPKINDLQTSDFHIYISAGKPVLAVELYNDPDGNSATVYTNPDSGVSGVYAPELDKHLEEVSKR